MLEKSGALRGHLKEVAGGPLADENRVFIFTPLSIHNIFGGGGLLKIIKSFFKCQKHFI